MLPDERSCRDSEAHRGRRATGRPTAMAYSGVSKASSDYSDRIIDSMCWLDG